jgi:hypothetical protein
VVSDKLYRILDFNSLVIKTQVTVMGRLLRLIMLWLRGVRTLTPRESSYIVIGIH